MNIDSSFLVKLADILGCKTGQVPISYLGLPLSVGKAKKQALNPVEEKLEKKLSTWKATYLSFCGRITLVKAILSNLYIVCLSSSAQCRWQIELNNCRLAA